MPTQKVGSQQYVATPGKLSGLLPATGYALAAEGSARNDSSIVIASETK